MSEQKGLPGFKCFIIGSPGTGKTFCLRTVEETPLEAAIIFLEPSMTTVADIPCPKLHYHHLKLGSSSWKDMLDMGRLVSTLANEDLQKLPKGSGNVEGKRIFFELIATLNDFVCDRCGKELGDTLEWGTDRLLAIDGLTGLSRLSRAMTVGYKPIPTQPDWGVMQENVDRLIYKIVMDLFCHFVLIGHVEPEKDEVSGGVKLYPSTLGRKLGPKLPSYFDDVLYSMRLGTDFLWSTVESGVDVKTRNLPLSAKIEQNLGILYDAWEGKQEATLKQIKQTGEKDAK